MFSTTSSLLSTKAKTELATFVGVRERQLKSSHSMYSEVVLTALDSIAFSLCCCQPSFLKTGKSRKSPVELPADCPAMAGRRMKEENPVGK